MKLKSSLLLAVAFATILASAARADVVDNAVANASARNDATGRELVIPYLAQQYGIARTPSGHDVMPSLGDDVWDGTRGLPTTATVSSTADAGSGWGIASIGAVVAVGAMLLALGVALTPRRSRQLLH
jgi:hypothetical protein